MQELKKLFEDKGQGHIFENFESLSDANKQSLLADCGNVDFEWLKTRTEQFNEDEAGAEHDAGTLTPAPVISLPKSDEDNAKLAEAVKVGEEALRGGKLAAFLVAGGQGTRLGFNGPKGCFPVGPITDKTLFQWHGEQILARAKKYSTTIPWYIMTSRANHDDTVKYFEDNNYLGFNKDDVKFFQQAVVPSIDFEGKLIRADKGHLAVNPDGHGGSLTALVNSGAIADMKKRGITTISYFQVDNPIVTICDPAFAGYHLQANAEMSSKILKKAEPLEKVGNICYANGQLTVIEYSDFDDEYSYAKDDSGELLFWAGSIAIHMLEVSFVEELAKKSQLPWHIAKKKIPFLDGDETSKPSEPNGVKFETFVFDALPFTSASVTMEVSREDEFAPVKNASGVDSAESCRQLQSNMFAKWLNAAGANIPASGDVDIKIEISPFYALDENEIISKSPTVDAGKDILLEN